MLLADHYYKTIYCANKHIWEIKIFFKKDAQILSSEL